MSGFHFPVFRSIKAGRTSIQDDNSGVALIEFAMVFPVLIVLYLGSFQIMEAVSTYRKLTATARSLGDMSGQLTQVTDAELDTIIAASTQIMAPYAVSKGTYRVSLINVSNAGVATVEASRSKNGTALTKGAAYTLPVSVKQNGLPVIVCDVTYNYTPIAFLSLIGNIPFRDQIFMMPRST